MNDDGIVARGSHKLQEVVGAQAHGCRIGHGVEIDLLVAALQKSRVQHQRDGPRVAEQGEGRRAALAHPQLLPQRRFLRKAQLPAPHPQFSSQVVQADLPVVQHGHQPEPFLLFVFKKEVFAVTSLHVLDVGHHFFDGEHLENITSVRLYPLISCIQAGIFC